MTDFIINEEHIFSSDSAPLCHHCPQLLLVLYATSKYITVHEPFEPSAVQRRHLGEQEAMEEENIIIELYQELNHAYVLLTSHMHDGLLAYPVYVSCIVLCIKNVQNTVKTKQVLSKDKLCV